jgi:hypothetical protein
VDGTKHVMKICIVGVGNIGMRYVQGITRKFPAAELWLVDHDVRLEELKKLEMANVTCVRSLAHVKAPIDIFVVATSCEPRLAIYKQCLALKPRYVILEKYLFKSRAEFAECLSLARVPTFVNQWMHGSRTFDCMFEHEASSVELVGSGWGLACNAPHWMDVFQRHMNIVQVRVGAGTTITDVQPSKRPGYEEVLGTWVFEDVDSNKSFKLIDRPTDSPVDGLRIKVDDAEYFFDYEAINKDGKVLSRFPYFSELIGDIVGEIAEKGTCSLPLLEASVDQHLLIEDILGKLDRRPNIT